MAESGSGTESSRRQAAWFVTTHWSMVLAAGHADSGPSKVALEQLCRTYWAPLYAYVRRRTPNPEDAQDLTQEFFAKLLSKHYLKTVQEGRGRFRGFLLASLQHFLANEWDKACAAKRGGGQCPIPLDDLNAENLYRSVSGPDGTPDEAYDRGWALALLEQVRQRLRNEYDRDGREGRFERWVAFLPGEASPQSYAETARHMGLTEEAVRSEVYRLRKRFRELVRQEIGQTVATPAEIEDELRHLIAVLSRVA